MDAPIDVRRYGTEGPAVFVLHGGPGGQGSVAALAAPLGDEFRVSEPRQRRADGRPLTVERHVADLAAVIDEPVALVGWSWGAMLALSFAALHPDVVRSVVLVGCGTYDEASRVEYSRTMQARFTDNDRARMDELRAELARAADRGEQDRLLAERGAFSERAQAFDLIEDDGQPQLPVDAIGHEQTWADVLRLQAEGIEPARFVAIRAPVLMLHGDHDPHPGPATRDVLRQHLPDLHYIELPQCGHTPWKERQAHQPFFKHLRTWLHTHP